MTLSAASLFAAASRAERPPSCWALVAEPAETPLLPVPELEVPDDDGGEHAATAARLAATAASAAREVPLERAEREERMDKPFLLRTRDRLDPVHGARSRTSTTPSSTRHRTADNDLNT